MEYVMNPVCVLSRGAVVSRPGGGGFHWGPALMLWANVSVGSVRTEKGIGVPFPKESVPVSVAFPVSFCFGNILKVWRKER